MSGARRALARIVACFRRADEDRELDAELASHLQLAEDDHVARGLDRGEARRRAHRELGGLGAVRELQRDARGLPFFDVLLQDLRHAVRTLRRDTGFSIVAVLVLALGIGATATVFSVVDGVLLEALPFEDPESLVWITNAPPGSAGLSSVSTRVPVLEEWRRRSRSFEAISGYFAFFGYGRHHLTGSGEAVRIEGVGVDHQFLDLLGVQPLHGRDFTAAEATLHAAPTVLLGHDLWRRRFAADPEIVGEAILLDGEPATVIGVLPSTFDFSGVFAPGTDVDLLTPLSLEAIAEVGNSMALIARLRPGVTVEAAGDELAEVTRQLLRDRPELPEHTYAHVTDLDGVIRGSAGRALWVLLGCVAAVLGLASANLAGLQLGRAIARRKELAIRSALGAGRGRLIRQLVTEAMVLATAGAALGLALAELGLRSLGHLPGLALPLLDRVQIDLPTLLVVALATALVGGVSGLAPIVQASRMRLDEALAAGTRGGSESGAASGARRALVVAEVAIACTLFVGAALAVRSFSRVLDVDLGFRPDRALRLTVEPGSEYQTDEARIAYLETLRLALDPLPEVAAVGMSDALPLDRNRTWGVSRPGEGIEDEDAAAFVSLVDHGYFAAIGTPLVAGRSFSPEESREGRPVVVLSRRLAEHLWSGEEAIGREVSVGSTPRIVIGLAGDVRHHSVERAADFAAYLPVGFQTGGAYDLVIRTRVDPARAVGAVRAALGRADPDLPTADLRPLAWLVERAVSSRRLVLTLLAGFAAFALLLASLGIYGVISYTARRRTREIGIRMALGATRADVVGRVLSDTLVLAGVGLGLGLVGALALGRAMRSLLYEVSALDPASYAMMVATVLVVAFVAGLLPARRAAAVDPQEALRAE